MAVERTDNQTSRAVGESDSATVIPAITDGERSSLLVYCQLR